MVCFATSKVLHMGDLYRTDGFPIGDLDDGGSVKGLIALLDSTIQSYPPDTKVIPGHGPLMTVADMRPFVEMLRDTRSRVAKGIQQGKTLDQLKQEKVLAGYESYAHQVSMDRFTEELYRELTWPKDFPDSLTDFAARVRIAIRLCDSAPGTPAGISRTARIPILR